MDLLGYLVPQQGLFGTVADFCMSTVSFSVLSVISLLTYFDILESFSLFHWLFKVGTWHKKLHREIKQVDHVLQRLGHRCTAAESGSRAPPNRGTEDPPHSPGGNTQQGDTEVGDVVTARDRRRIQLLSSKLQSMKIYTEERLQLLNSFASCHESYQLSYSLLHGWVSRTRKFQEWIHSVQCDSEALIIEKLSHQKRIVEEIEERAPQLDNCRRMVSECVRVFKQIELQMASFKANVKQDQCLAGVKSQLPSTFPGSIHQEVTSTTLSLDDFGLCVVHGEGDPLSATDHLPLPVAQCPQRAGVGRHWKGLGSLPEDGPKTQHQIYLGDFTGCLTRTRDPKPILRNPHGYSFHTRGKMS
uniref:uncharacterized protein isoform X2 n=1 Tax=Pristiophorus japonicus TaxID=55135 RepID=UPI00398F34B1